MTPSGGHRWLHLLAILRRHFFPEVRQVHDALIVGPAVQPGVGWWRWWDARPVCAQFCGRRRRWIRNPHPGVWRADAMAAKLIPSSGELDHLRHGRWRDGWYLLDRGRRVHRWRSVRCRRSVRQIVSCWVAAVGWRISVGVSVRIAVERGPPSVEADGHRHDEGESIESPSTEE